MAAVPGSHPEFSAARAPPVAPGEMLAGKYRPSAAIKITCNPMGTPECCVGFECKGDACEPCVAAGVKCLRSRRARRRSPSS